MRADVVIVGGGAIGSAAAYFLRGHPRPCTVAVIERDPGYGQASTPRASGGVRRLFSLPENIALSNYGIPFFERFDTAMAVAGEPAAIGFKKNGYLFIVPPSAVGARKDIQVFERPSAIEVNRVGVLWRCHLIGFLFRCRPRNRAVADREAAGDVVDRLTPADPSALRCASWPLISFRVSRNAGPAVNHTGSPSGATGVSVLLMVFAECVAHVTRRRGNRP